MTADPTEALCKRLETRADWHARHIVSGPAYCYTIGDQRMDEEAAAALRRQQEEIGRLQM